MDRPIELMAYLSASHQIATTADDGNRVLLDGRRHSVSGKANIFEESGIKRRAGELGDSLGDVRARGLDGDVVVFFKVDARVLHGARVYLSVEFFFESGVALARDMTPVFPGALVGGPTAPVGSGLARLGGIPGCCRSLSRPATVGGSTWARIGGSTATVVSAVGARGESTAASSSTEATARRSGPARSAYRVSILIDSER